MSVIRGICECLGLGYCILKDHYVLYIYIYIYMYILNKVWTLYFYGIVPILWFGAYVLFGVWFDVFLTWVFYYGFAYAFSVIMTF